MRPFATQKVEIKTLDINFPSVQYILLVVSLSHSGGALPCNLNAVKYRMHKYIIHAGDGSLNVLSFDSTYINIFFVKHSALLKLCAP